MKIIIPSLIIAISTFSCNIQENKKGQATEQGPVKVELTVQNGSYKLLRGNKPYFIKGAGIEPGKIPILFRNGANSCRIWSTETDMYKASEILDIAHAYNLTVTLGLDVKKERHGFDYSDTVAVKKQFEYLKGEVQKYKDHPALLIWGIGNELNLNYNNPKVWDAVNQLAKMVKEIDPNHPTTTMLAGIKKTDIDYIRERCPDLDFISIQMYGDLPNLQSRITESGYTGPYIVTEWGATGHWETAKTKWGAPIEQTSKEKAQSYIDRYQKAIAPDSARCLGSYVFYWGQKQERTPTWYGLFTEEGKTTETVDAMHYIWTGKWPKNRAPQLDSLQLNGLKPSDNIKLNKGQVYKAKVFVKNKEKEILSYNWELLHESTDLGVGGDYENRPESLKGLISPANSPTVQLTAPNIKGAFRLFVYVSDSHNKVATANIPFYVND